MKVLTVFGTRPEAIKMAPLVHALAKDPFFEAKVCVTAQHREMLDQVLKLFSIVPDYDLNIMQPGQGLTEITCRILEGLKPILAEFKPDVVLVHGDTTTTLATSLAAFYQRIPVGHVEAGLRTGDLYSPWPEEANRTLTGHLAMYHFSPTETSRQNLLRENVADSRIFITGNTVIDALLWVRDGDAATRCVQNWRQITRLSTPIKMILVTGHRRETSVVALKKSAMRWQTSPPRTGHPDCLRASQPERQRAGQSHSGACEKCHSDRSRVFTVCLADEPRG
ncbi:UDP-N-acetylglucosamine 2-epimerase [Escherichia coli]|nr:UDP-N-acetylglucosamine 2-epimerase [Escherichia coli]